MTGSFEAKKIAWRQTKDGLVLALSIHPDDLSQEMALSPLNTRYMIAFSEIGDDEKPREPVTGNGKPDLRALGDKLEKQPLSEGVQPDGSYRQVSAANGHPKKWSEYKRSQQAHILCSDPDFWAYFKANSSENAADLLRTHLRISSRKELDTNPKTAAMWDEMVALYRLHCERRP